ncbi:MAG: hypothetical protein ACK5NF_07885 [Bacilli bacterium]
MRKKIMKLFTIAFAFVAIATPVGFNAQTIDQTIDRIDGEKAHHHYVHFYNVNNEDYTGVQAEHIKSGEYIGVKLEACGNTSGPYYNTGDVSTDIITCYDNNASGWLPATKEYWYE